MVSDGGRRVLRLPQAPPDDFVLFLECGAEAIEVLFCGALPAMVVIGGEVRLASDDIAPRLPDRVLRGMRRFRVDGREMFTTVDIEYLWRETAPHIGTEIRLAGRRITL